MSYNFHILEKFSLGHAKSWSWGREFEKILDFFLTPHVFFNSSRAVLFSEGQKNIFWALIDVKFHKLSNCVFTNRGSKSAVIFNSAHKHRAHNFRRSCTTVGKNLCEFWYKIKILHLFIQITFISFKVFPFRYNALMPTFFPIVETLVKFDFRNCLQSLLRCGLYFFHRVKTVSSECSFEFVE